MATTSMRRAGGRGGGLSSTRREALEGFLYISPWIVGFLLFTLGPMLASLYLSFTRYTMIRPPDFIGFDNYVVIFTQDRLFLDSLWRTTVYAIATVIIGVAGSLGLAMLLNQRLVGAAFFRTLFFLPSLTPVVASALVWGWIFHPQLGLLNDSLRLAGIQGPGWLTTVEWAVPALIIIALWGSLGGARMIIFLAGLQGVPQELYEAASMDGANVWSRFRNVTLPIITPTIFFNMVLGVIASFSVFTVAYVATQGGPARATYFYVYHIFARGFQDFDMGYASALAWVFFAILLAFTAVQFRLQRHWVYYEADGNR
jgi:multiple sugar transport system permease protein